MTLDREPANPIVVVVDDDAIRAEAILTAVEPYVQAEVVDSEVMSSEESLALLAQADLILVDQRLSDIADEAPPTASNGLALIPVLREYVQKQFKSDPSFALFSSQLSELSALPQEARAHVLARGHNFEWALSKNTEENAIGLEVTVPALAHGSTRIRDVFDAYEADDDAADLDDPSEADDPSDTSNPSGAFEATGSGPGREPHHDAANDGQVRSDDATSTSRDTDAQQASGPPELDLLHQVLALPSQSWRSEASRQVELARPPIYTAQGRSPAVPVRRWLLHRVIPYPTFLYSAANVAARLALPVDVTRALLDDELRDLFEPARYEGAFCDLDGARFWRVGADLIIEELSDGDTASLQAEVERRAGRRLPFIDHPRPVLVLDPKTWEPENLPVAPGETVRVQLDDWPAHAEPARVRTDRASSQTVASIVVEADRDRLPRRVGR